MKDKHYIIGTAGHIDHGKTTLIKRLTGTDTDRLKEEKKRGITIELGFTFFDMPSGRRAGIVDVPGHERFIKNMLAGASGIDAVIMIISAEEGVMPQTREHLDILSILQVEKGVIALTKSDLVDEEWIEIVKEDVREAVQGTFLADAEIVEVSSFTGHNMDVLTEKVDHLLEETEARDAYSPARLPIDRVFTMQGFGTVVTGTLIEGTINAEDNMMVYPSMKAARIRKVQVHGHDVGTASAGQRVALNLAGIAKDELHRGDVLAVEGSIQESMMIDVKINLLTHGGRTLPNWTRLRLYHGTKEILCRLVLLDREEIKPGEECYAQLRLEEPICAKYNDLFVLRFYSPLETIGGGSILDTNPKKHKRFKDDIIESLEKKEEGDIGQLIESTIKKLGETFPTIDTISLESGLSKEDVQSELATLIEQQIIIDVVPKKYIHQDYFMAMTDEITRRINNYHSKNPLKAGVLKEELRNQVCKQLKVKEFDTILETMVQSNEIIVHGTTIALANFTIQYSERDLKTIENLLSYYNEKKLSPENFKEVMQQLRLSKKDVDIVNNLSNENKLVKINEEVYLLNEHYQRAKDILINYLHENTTISLAQYRDECGTSRKIAVALLEHFDQCRVTRRKENVRVLLKG